MVQPTTYQRTVIEAAGLDPEIWWPVQWGYSFCTLKNRATNELLSLDGIEGYGEGNCRNLAHDEDDPMHDYIPKVNGGGEGYLQHH